MSIKNAFKPPVVGDTVRFRKTLTVAEQAMFTGISGNLGGLYTDRTAAAACKLPDMAVFELVIASLLTTCLTRLAGPQHRIATFHTAYSRAVAVGTTVAARATLTEAGEGVLTFSLLCTAGDDTVCEGRATMVPVGGV